MSRIARRYAGIVLVGLALGFGSWSTAAETGEDRIAARVDGVPITMGEVTRFRQQHLAPDEAAGGERQRLDAAVLEQLIRQRLVVGYLQRTRQAASQAQVEAEIARLKASVERQQVDWTEHLSKHYGDEGALARYLAWRLSWSRYMAKQSTDKALAEYFDAHRRDFDGTRMRVSQILWKVDRDDTAARQQALAIAQRVHGELLAQRTSFTEAVAEYSQGPSREEQGDLGFISRHGEMHEAFARAAFRLEPGQIGRPVLTPHGVHLIRVTELRPGSNTFDDVRAAVEEQLAREMFERIVAAERKRATIELSGDVAHFDPTTGKLVLP